MNSWLHHVHHPDTYYTDSWSTSSALSRTCWAASRDALSVYVSVFDMTQLGIKLVTFFIWSRCSNHSAATEAAIGKEFVNIWPLDPRCIWYNFHPHKIRFPCMYKLTFVETIWNKMLRESKYLSLIFWNIKFTM